MPLAGFPPDAGEWTALAARSGNLFGSWEWLATWWRHFGRGRLLLHEVRAVDGRLVALLPLYASGRRPLRVLRFVGHGTSDQLGPVAEAADLPAATKALAAVLQEEEWDLLLGHDLPAGFGWENALGAGPLWRMASPVVDLGGLDWEGFLSSRSRSFRQRLRQLERQGGFSGRLVTEPDELEDAMSKLFFLHGRLWRGRGDSSSFRGGLREFHRDFARTALERGWLRLRLLELDGRTVAALYNFRFGGSEYCYETARDPAVRQLSPLFLLHCHAICDALEDELAEYRFLRGDEPYKWRFAGRDAGVVTVGLAAGRAGGALLASVRESRRFAPSMRRRLPALYRVDPKARRG